MRVKIEYINQKSAIDFSITYQQNILYKEYHLSHLWGKTFLWH